MCGEYTHTVDSKGRMNFPAKLREELGDKFYISKTLRRKCLTVHTDASWQKIINKLQDQPAKLAQPLECFFFGGACEAEPDKQGRIALPASLRAFADIKTDVIVVGSNDHAEIWDMENWLEYTRATNMDYLESLADGMGL